MVFGDGAGERGLRRGNPAPAVHGSGGPFLPRLSPAAIRTPAATPGGAFARRPLGYQTWFPAPATQAHGERGVARCPDVAAPLIDDRRRCALSANSREAADAPAAEGCPGNEALGLKRAVLELETLPGNKGAPGGGVFGMRGPGSRGAHRLLLPCAPAWPPCT